MTTREEKYGERSLIFSAWIRENLPDSSTGFCVTNQDWIFYNWRKKRLILAEEKTNLGYVADWFKQLISDVIDPALSEYCPKHGIDYRGYYIIKFDNEGPEDSDIILLEKISDKKHSITSEQLKILLSMED